MSSPQQHPTSSTSKMIPSVTPPVLLATKEDLRLLMEQVNHTLTTYASIQALEVSYRMMTSTVVGLMKSQNQHGFEPLLQKVNNIENAVERVFQHLSGRCYINEQNLVAEMQRVDGKFNSVENEIRSIVDKENVRRSLEHIVPTIAKLKQDMSTLLSLSKSIHIPQDIQAHKEHLANIDSQIITQAIQIQNISANYTLHTVNLSDIFGKINQITSTLGEFSGSPSAASISEQVHTLSNLPSEFQQMEVRLGSLSRHCQELALSIGHTSGPSAQLMPSNNVKKNDIKGGSPSSSLLVKATDVTPDASFSIVSRLENLERRMGFAEGQIASIQEALKDSSLESNFQSLQTEIQLLKLGLEHTQTVIADLRRSSRGKNDLATLDQLSIGDDSFVKVEEIGSAVASAPVANEPETTSPNFE